MILRGPTLGRLSWRSVLAVLAITLPPLLSAGAEPPAANPKETAPTLRRGDKTPALTEEVQAAQDEVEVLRARQEVKEAECEVFRVNLQNAEQRYKLMERVLPGVPGAFAKKDCMDAREEVTKLQGDLRARKAELSEATERLQKAESRLALLQKTAASPDPKHSEPAATRGPSLTGELQATQEVELLRAQLEVKQAERKAVQVPLRFVEKRLELLINCGGFRPFELQSLRGDVANIQAAVRVKKAEERELEIRLRQAERRLATLQPAADPDAEKRRQLETGLRELERQIQRLMEAKKGLELELKKMKDGPTPK
jgi:chromosome segregation ATPase